LVGLTHAVLAWCGEVLLREEAFELYQSGVAAQVHESVRSESAIRNHAQLEVIEGELEGIVVLAQVHDDAGVEEVEITQSDEVGSASGTDGGLTGDLGVSDSNGVIVGTEESRRLGCIDAQGEIELPASNLHEVAASTATDKRLTPDFELVEDDHIAAITEVGKKVPANDAAEDANLVILLGGGEHQRTANDSVLDGENVKSLPGQNGDVAVKLQRCRRGLKQDGVVLVAGVNEEVVVGNDVLDQDTVVAGTGVDENRGVEDDQPAAGRDLQDIVASPQINVDFADAAGDDGDGAEVAIDLRGSVARSDDQTKGIGLNDLDAVAFIVADNIEHAVVDINHDIASGNRAGFEKFQMKACGKRLRHGCSFSCCSVYGGSARPWTMTWFLERMQGARAVRSRKGVGARLRAGRVPVRPDTKPNCTPHSSRPGDGIDDSKSKNRGKCKTQKFCGDSAKCTKRCNHRL
jgi:hypothetical protein